VSTLAALLHPRIGPLERLSSVINPDPNRSGRQYALTVMSPILDGHEEALRRVVRDFPTGPESPFARVPELHFARVVIIPELVWEGGGEPTEQLSNHYLLLSTCSTSKLDDHLEALRASMPSELDAIWSHCVRYPGAGSEVAFHGWVRTGQIETSLFHAGYPDASVQDVRDSVALRDDLVSFALDSQDLPPDEAQRMYIERFVRP
jgi:hypothetical protein